MANMNLPPQERAFGVTNIKSHIPIILDDDEHNYDAWKELFLTHCQTFDVSGYLDGTVLPADDNDVAWRKKDGLVKLWLYGTLSKSLFKSTFKTGGTSREIWLRVENFFRNNKEAKAIQLDHDLRTKVIGDKTIQVYCQELKSLDDLMSNVDAPVPERTLVTYMLNGLNAKYDNIINVIMHRQPFPTYEDARSMLLLEEDRLSRGKKPDTNHKDTSSADKVLVATASNNESKHTAAASNTNQRPYNNRSRGRGRGRGRSNNQRPQFQQWTSPFWTNTYPDWMQQQFNPWTQQQQLQPQQQGLLGPRPQYVATPNHKQQALQTGTAIQPTMDFASAFNTMTLVDPSDNNWYMDSGATAHLANSSGSTHAEDYSPQ
ncbi:unnamed protein product [Brassica oleracea var. botrytis]